jgi:signal transduction histidine kinase/ActR/RegA family two-component response regulator
MENKPEKSENPNEINPELRKYINQYFKEYHIKDCLVVLPDNINLIGDNNPFIPATTTGTASKYIIKHISATHGTDGLCINIARDTDTLTSNSPPASANDTKSQPPDSDRLHELIGEYMSRLATLVEQSISREPKPAAVWKHRNFLSSISHQIKTPLSAIFSGTKLIKHYTNNEYIDRICEYMNQSCVELTRYMNDIIDFYYLKQGVLILDDNRVSISDTLDYVYENYRLQCQDAEIVFEKHIAPEVPQIIICDELRLTQILMNLMDNAVKFTSHPDIPDEQTTESTPKKICIRVSISSGTEPSGQKIIIQVADNGIGKIDIANQEQYFQPFNQTTRNWLNAPDGIGLGLCLSRDFARKMGGCLAFIRPSKIQSCAALASKYTMHTEYNTCIELSLPLTQITDKPKHAKKQPAQKVSINEHPQTQPVISATEIVIIDDNQTNIELLTLILEQLGYKNIKSFTNSITGQNYITEFATRVSHAIIDIRMPRKNGLDLISEIASGCSNTHFILLTALRHDDVRTQFSSIKLQHPDMIMSLLFKPVDCGELRKLLSTSPKNKVINLAVSPSSGTCSINAKRTSYV